MNPIPRRCWIYGLTAIVHLIFTLVFPFYSVPIVVWFMTHNIYHKSIILLSVPFFAILGYYAFKRWPVIKQSRKLMLLLVTVVILYITVYESVPDFGEKLHVLNFSVLAVVFYKAFSPIMKIHWALLLSWLIASAVGAGDEYMQRFIPGRSGCLHDVLIAVRSGVLGGIIAWIFDAYSRKGRGVKNPLS